MVRLIILSFLFTSYFVTFAQSEVNSVDIQNIEQNKEKALQEQKPNWIFQRFDILLGFALGLLGTIIIDVAREHRKVTRFRNAASNELKQLLADLNIYALHKDSLINKEKALLWWNSSQEFGLYEQVCPTEDNQEYKKLINAKNFPDLVD